MPRFSYDPLAKLSAKKLFWLVFAVSFLVILFRLSSLLIPPVLTIDEASIGLNAQDILRIGADEWGQHLPLFFKAFGEYKSPIFIYSTLPFIKILGISLYSVRLTSAVWGLLLVIFATIFVWELTKNKTVAFTALVVTATLPWSFQISHLGYEVITFPALLTLALLLCHSGLDPESRQDKGWVSVVGAFLLGLTLYTYPTARLLVLLYFLLILCLLIERPLQRLMFSVVFVATSLPFLITTIQNPAIIFNRLNEISIFSQPAPLLHFVANYLSYFSPQFLFLNGSPDILFSTGRSGVIFISFLLPLLTGLLLLIHLAKNKNCWAWFLLIGLLTAPLASALTFDNQPHLLRAAGIIPFLVIPITLGTWYLLKKLPKVISFSLVLIFVLETSLYLYDFNFVYPKRVLASPAVETVTAPSFNRLDLLTFYRK